MKLRALKGVFIGVVFAGGMPAFSSDSRENQSDTAWMIGQAKAWADQACGGKWVLSDILADDFKGTSPKGDRYEKPKEVPVFDSSTKWSKDCRLDQAELRYFGTDVAVMYGAESKTVENSEGRDERRCLVWTDTWMKRDGKWQIIAVQDNRIDCPAR